MQTFFTRASFFRSAADLDDARLGKQRQEALQILNTLTGSSKAYRGHPVTFMWQTYESALCIYGMIVCMEWSLKRGFSDKVFWEFSRKADEMRKQEALYFEKPPWFNDADVIRSHRSNLVRMDGDVYGPLFPRTPKDMPYLWPVVSEDGSYELKVSKPELQLLRSGERRLAPEVAERVSNL